MNTHSTESPTAEWRARVQTIPQPSECVHDMTSLTQATIMMIDDESTTMEVMQAFLEEAGYQRFVLLDDSSHALEKIEAVQPDIVLLDLMMPNVSGFEILQWVRRHSHLAHTPILILTSSTDAETKLKALDQGATDFLAKPVDSSELILRVRNTLAAKAYQNQLAYYDELTKLPNRSLFLDRLAWFLQQAESHHTNLVMLHITLPQFKRIHQTLGPIAGDQVIRQIADRIQACVRSTDVVGRGISDEPEATCLFRVGNDEFSVICPSVLHPENAIKIASRIMSIMQLPFHSGDTEVSLSPCIGLASYPTDAVDIETLVQCAVGASAQAQIQGGYQFYSSAMNTTSYQRLQLEAELRHAIAQEKLVLYYQPKVDIQSGHIAGLEALVRWPQTDGTVILPDDFISLAEESGLILPLGNWAIKEGCAQLARWQAQGIEIHLSVNLSPNQFHSPNLVQMVRNYLQDYQVDAKYLTLELTESLVMDHAERAVDTLRQLVDLGLKFSMDDFGTGYSSLSYLKRLPLDELKIDRSFITDLPNKSEDQALVSAMIYLAHEFKLKVVAEGVETQAQLDLLAKLGCDEYQGFLFSQPVNAVDVTPMLAGLCHRSNK